MLGGQRVAGIRALPAVLLPRGDLRLLDDLGVLGRYGSQLPGFFRTTLDESQARREVSAQLAGRADTFVALLERAVYGGRDNVYRRLLRAAGVELGDVAALVRDLGLEGALRRLYDAGVHVTLDEFKGRRPIERLGVSIDSGAKGFDNPLLTRHFEAATGGTRGARRRVSVDLDLLAHEAASLLLMRVAYGSLDRPFGVWRPVLPSSSGINNCLRQAKLGRPVAAWFNPYAPPLTLDATAFRLFTSATLSAAWLFGSRIAAPTACGPEHADRVARWLAACKRRGRPAVLDTQAALGVRACAAAIEEGIDVAGTLLGVGGEPFTPQKAAVIAEAGCDVYCTYSMTETGRIALGCSDSEEIDDMHLLSDKLAVLQLDRAVGPGGASVGALYYTSLLLSSPKIMINVESDDYAVLSVRSCGCPLGAVGLTTHIRDVRSYEKLTAEGNHFLGSDLVDLVDRVLPEQFGGGPTDYQLVEEEIGGLPRVSVVARPSLGPLVEADVVSAVIGYLAEAPRNRLMADVWRDGGTLRLVRREPITSVAGKILPLHLVQHR